MGWWDWATTGREDVQKIGGKAVGGAKGYLSSPAGVISGAVGPVAGLPAAAIQGVDWLRNRGGDGGGGGGGQPAAAQPAAPADPAAAAKAAQQQAATGTPAAGDQSFLTGGHPLLNPLNVQGYYGGVIAPMMGQIMKQYGDQSAEWQKNLSSQMMQMPPQFRAQFQKQQTQSAQDQSNVMAALMQSAAAGPAWDKTQQQLGDIQTQTQQLYAKELANQALGTSGINLLPNGTIDPNSPILNPSK